MNKDIILKALDTKDARILDSHIKSLLDIYTRLNELINAKKDVGYYITMKNTGMARNIQEQITFLNYINKIIERNYLKISPNEIDEVKSLIMNLLSTLDEIRNSFRKHDNTLIRENNNKLLKLIQFYIL